MIDKLRRHLRRGHREERGQVLMIAVLFIGILAGAAAIAVDTGAYMSHRRSTQNAADAIALAASQALPNSSAVMALANSWAEMNGIQPGEMAVTITQQNLSSEPNPKVTVDLTVNHDLTFMSILGMDSAEVNVTATAIRTSPGGGDGMMPWSVLETAKNAANPGVPLVLKYDASDVTNGNFGALRLDGNGANVYRDTIKFGSDTTYCAASAADCNAPSIAPTEPGNMTGPTKAGTDYRINNSSPSCDTWAEVVIDNADGTHTLNPPCNPFGSGGNAASLRVIVIPVINSLCNGACNVTILEFALFFLEGYGAGGCTGNDCEIAGRFINSNTNYGSLIGTFDESTFVHFVRLVE